MARIARGILVTAVCMLLLAVAAGCGSSQPGAAVTTPATSACKDSFHARTFEGSLTACATLSEWRQYAATVPSLYSDPAWKGVRSLCNRRHVSNGLCASVRQFTPCEAAWDISIEDAGDPSFMAACSLNDYVNATGYGKSSASEVLRSKCDAFAVDRGILTPVHGATIPGYPLCTEVAQAPLTTAEQKAQDHADGVAADYIRNHLP